MGPSVGVSVIPGSSKVANALATRFPGLKQLLFPGSVPKLGNDLLKWLTDQPGFVARTLWNSPTLIKLAPTIAKVAAPLAAGASLGPTTLPSLAIGLVTANAGRTLEQGDFAGSCVMFAAVGTAAIAGGGVYALAFGLARAWNPLC
jgi:hypothetical protein